MADAARALAEARSAVAWPDEDGADLTSTVVAGLAPRRGPRRWPAIVAVGVVGAVMTVPVAADLAVRGVRITTGPLPAGIGDDVDLGEPTQVRAAAPRPPSLGLPAAAFAGEPAGGYSEVWPGPILLTSFPGRLDRALIEKRIAGGGDVEETTVDGAPAYWIRGPHGFLYLDDDGEPREDTLRLSRNALLWTRDGTTYRLESDRSLAESVALAESMF